jgi:hypothetical protein
MSKGRAQGKKGMNEGDGRTRGEWQASAQNHREAVSFNALLTCCSRPREDLVIDI